MSEKQKKILKYSEEDMQAAIVDCRTGKAIATAARQHKVPRTTLLYKVRGIHPEGRKMGPKTLFSNEEENRIVDWIKTLAKRKFPVNRGIFIASVRKLATELGKGEEMRNRNFKIGRKWFEGFMKRHRDVSERVCQNLTKSRTTVSETQIRNWFDEVEEYLVSNNFFDILSNPTRIYNTDESAFFLNPKGLKVLAQRGDKSIYQAASNDEKECLTVLINCSADGQLAPPLIIFRYQRIPGILAESVPKSWGIGRSDSGWMTAESFYEYITNVFHPWLVKKNILLPVILFVDGHVSHMSMPLSEFCSKNGIILVALFPNSTHLLQPLDVAVFKTLKAGWKERISEWRLANNNPDLKRHQFAPLLDEVLKNRITSQILKNGFRKCGLYPWNKDAVDYAKISTERENFDPTYGTIAKEYCETRQDTISFLKMFEKNLEPEKLARFKKYKRFDWSGDIADKNLFQFWKKISLKCDQNQINTPSSEIQPSISCKSGVNTIFGKDQSIQSSPPTEPYHLTCEAGANALTDIVVHSTPVKETQSKETPTPLNININITTTNNSDIPSPFKRALFYPGEKDQEVKKRKREKVPSVITSDSWQEYNRKKILQKEQKENEKLERKIKRIEKIEAKKTAEDDKIKKRKINKQSKKSDVSSEDEEVEYAESDDSVWNVEDEKEDEIEQIKVIENINQLKNGCFVLVNFMGGKRNSQKFVYVCTVQQIIGQEISVMALNCVDTARKSFVANENDISLVTLDQIVGILDNPEIVAIGERLRYIFPVSISNLHEK